MGIYRRVAGRIRGGVFTVKPGLQVGFGRPLGGELLGDVKAQGFEVVRIQAFLSDEPGFPQVSAGETAVLVQEVLEAGLLPLTIIRDAAQVQHVPAGLPVEFGNEPDLGGQFGWPDPDEYLAGFHRAISAAEGRNPIFGGVVSNLNRRGFRYLKNMHWEEIPAWVGCSVHRYPDAGGGPFHGHVKPLFQKRWTRQDEVDYLRELVGDRPLALTEIGYNNIDFTEIEAAEFMAFERGFWGANGFAMGIGYQMCDGPGATVEERWGFRKYDNGPLGPWKPVAKTWTGQGI